MNCTTITPPPLSLGPLRTLCAWCGLVLREGPPAPVSHGICPLCLAAEKAVIRDLVDPREPAHDRERPEC